MRKHLKLLLVVLPALLIVLPAKANGLNSCGFQPIAKAGCVIGRCVNGAWEQVCGSSANTLQPVSDSLLNNIANPKLADIPAAIEYRESREQKQQKYAPPKEADIPAAIEYRESREQQQQQQQQEYAPPKAAATQQEKRSQLEIFEALLESDPKLASVIIAAYGEALDTANYMIQLRKGKPLFCKNTILSTSDYKAIFKTKYIKHKADFNENKSQVSHILLFGLIETFPCPESGWSLTDNR